MTTEASSSAAAAGRPGPGHRRLEAFVGRWRTEGRTAAGPSGPAAEIAGEDRYEWLPGGFFLVHRVDVRVGGERVSAIEIIGYDPASGTYPMHWFDGQGGSGTYRASLRDGVWTFAGESERFTGSFGDGGGTLTGSWERVEDGAGWVPWMEVRLTKLSEPLP